MKVQNLVVKKTLPDIIAINNVLLLLLFVLTLLNINAVL